MNRLMGAYGASANDPVTGNFQMTSLGFYRNECTYEFFQKHKMEMAELALSIFAICVIIITISITYIYCKSKNRRNPQR